MTRVGNRKRILSRESSNGNFLHTDNEDQGNLHQQQQHQHQQQLTPPFQKRLLRETSVGSAVSRGAGSGGGSGGRARSIVQSTATSTSSTVIPPLPFLSSIKSYYWDQQSRDGREEDLGGSTRSLPHWNATSPLSPLANPQSGVVEEKDQQQQQQNEQDYLQDSPPAGRNTLVFTARKKKSSLPMTVILVCLLSFCLYSTTQSTLEQAVQDGDRLVAFTERLRYQMEKAQKDIRILERELDALDRIQDAKIDMEEEEKILQQIAAPFLSNPQILEEIRLGQESLKESTQQVQKLKEQIQAMSKRDTLETYGLGPYRVEMELSFPSSSSSSASGGGGGGTDPHFLIIELAPLDLVPHSVYTFLEMISMGVLEHSSFVLNSQNMIKAITNSLPKKESMNITPTQNMAGVETVAAASTETPGVDETASGAAATTTDMDTDTSEKKENDGTLPFLQTRDGIMMDGVAFREYNPEYPHKQYTLGFVGDGTTAFYINTNDNTDHHMGDPCFGMIISGMDTLQRLTSSRTIGKHGIVLEHPIQIKKARILR